MTALMENLPYIFWSPTQQRGMVPFASVILSAAPHVLPLITSWMGAESKNPGAVSFSMLLQGVLSMLSCIPTGMEQATRRRPTFKGEPTKSSL